MRRWILTGVTVLALLLAVGVGPLGAAAAAPYVYGCTPARLSGTLEIVELSIYNGSATTASLTIKGLAGNGAIVDTPETFISSLPATHTYYFTIGLGGGPSGETNGSFVDSFRIVSSVPVAATLDHEYPTASDRVPIACAPLVP